MRVDEQPFEVVENIFLHSKNIHFSHCTDCSYTFRYVVFYSVKSMSKYRKIVVIEGLYIFLKKQVNPLQVVLMKKFYDVFRQW